MFLLFSTMDFLFFQQAQDLCYSSVDTLMTGSAIPKGNVPFHNAWRKQIFLVSVEWFLSKWEIHDLRWHSHTQPFLCLLSLTLLCIQYLHLYKGKQPQRSLLISWWSWIYSFATLWFRKYHPPANIYISDSVILNRKYCWHCSIL